MSDYHKEYYQQNKWLWKLYQKNKTPEQIFRDKQNMRAYYQKIKRNPLMLKRLRDQQKNRGYEIKYEVLLHYSPKGSRKPRCGCCGENKLLFLNLDHDPPVGGSASGNRIFGGNFYRVVKKLGFPKGFKTRCWNCNIARSYNNNKCPHNT